MSDWDDGDWESGADYFGELFGFEDDDTAKALFEEGFLTSSDPDNDWYDPDVSPDDRHEAREAFEDWIEENYDDFDWDTFWEEWAEFYGDN